MHWMDGFGGGWMMILWWIIIIAAIVIIVRFAINTTGRSQKEDKSALDILKERYAKGEIDDEEFKKRKKELLK